MSAERTRSGSAVSGLEGSSFLRLSLHRRGMMMSVDNDFPSTRTAKCLVSEEIRAWRVCTPGRFEVQEQPNTVSLKKERPVRETARKNTKEITFGDPPERFLVRGPNCA